jgi:hypothetical protein
MDDASLIRMFTDLSGEADSAGRSVLMFLDVLEDDMAVKTGREPNVGSKPEVQKDSTGTTSKPH